MAKAKMKGVTSIERNGAVYWYARVNGQRAYCGKDAKGKKLAEVANDMTELKAWLAEKHPKAEEKEDEEKTE